MLAVADLGVHVAGATDHDVAVVAGDDDVLADGTVVVVVEAVSTDCERVGARRKRRPFVGVYRERAIATDLLRPFDIGKVETVAGVVFVDIVVVGIYFVVGVFVVLVVGVFDGRAGAR